MSRYIPNALWLFAGVGFTGYTLSLMDAPIGFLLYLAVGVILSCAFLIFENPRDGGTRLDISLCVPILAVMWPLIRLLMILQAVEERQVEEST
jgi:hypothetical protein